MTRKWPTGGAFVLTIAMTVLGAALALYSLAGQWAHRNIVPIGDMIDVIRLLDADPTPSLHDLWNYRDNEHRPILPFFLFQLDHGSFGSTGRLLFPALYGAMALLAIMCAVWAFAIGVPRSTQALLLAIAMALFFWVGHWENLLWEKQVHEILSLLFVALAFFVAAKVLCRSANDAGPLDLTYAALSAAFATAATYSFGFGIPAFIAIGAHGILARWRPRAIIVFLSIAACALLPYLLTYQIIRRHADPTETILRLGPLLGYAGTVLSSPICAAADSIVGLHVNDLFRSTPAWMSAMATLPVAIKRYIRRDKYLPARAVPALDFCLLLSGSTLGMALLIALGRLGINAGTESRYAVLSSVFWMSQIGVMLSITAPGRQPWLALGASFLVLALLAVSTPRLMVLIRNQQQTIMGGAVAATLGAFDLPIYLLYPFPAGLEQIWRRPRPPFPSFAEREPFRLLETPADKLPLREHGHCFGTLEVADPLDTARSFYQVSGWGFTEAGTPAAAWALLVDADGLVVGIGQPDLNRPDVLKSYVSQQVRGETFAMAHSGFRAVVRSARATSLTLWMVDENGRACPLR